MSVTVKVLRAFFLNGASIPVEAKLQLPQPLASELVAANKAEYAEPDLIPDPEPKPEPIKPKPIKDEPRN